MGADFTGFATKANIKCADGRTIMPDAFKHQDGQKVPLVWQHDHDNPENVLGHAILRAVDGHMRVEAFFNTTPRGVAGKALVDHEDINQLSIWAGKLVERGKQVFHGMIKEVSLVLAGSNKGALIDNVQIAHSDGTIEDISDEAIIYMGTIIEHGDSDESDELEEVEEVEHADDTQTLADIFNSMTPEQQDAVAFMVQTAVEENTAEHSDDNQGEEGTDEMRRNVFEGKTDDKEGRASLTHADFLSIMEDFKKGGTFKSALEKFAAEKSLAHGIDDIDLLFPDAQNVDTTPQFDKRRTEWVASVLNDTKHSPFSRVRTIWADITHDEARAKGYVKGSLKKEEFFGISRRTTGPKTVYKKQALDRDDVIDITDFQVIAWVKGEMRVMFDEEIARAVLISDGRDIEDEDKIPDPAGAVAGDGIRSIYNDHELFAAKAYVNLGDASSTPLEAVDRLLEQRKLYKGTGTPTFYTTESFLTSLLLLRDTTGRRLYRTVDELASELRVAAIVPVEPMEDIPDLVGIMVNLMDYTLGADKGGEINLFDDFDIDYNKLKYLMESRLSGGLTKIRSAVVIIRTANSDVLVESPNAPTFVPATGVVTIVATTGVVYKNEDTGGTLSTGAQTALAAGATMNVVATPASGYYLKNNVEYRWSFTRPLA